MTTAVLVYKKAAAIQLPHINWKTVCFLGIIITMILSVFYVMQVNFLTQGSYLILSYENKMGELSQENENLEVSFAESSFLEGALSKIQEMNFQKVTSVKYIQIPDNSLARAK